MKISNPTTDAVIAEIEISTKEEIHATVEKSRLAQQSWANLGVAGRVEILKDVLKQFEEHLTEIGELATQCMGMPIALRGLMDLDAGMEYFRWYLEHATEHLSSEISYEDEKSINTVYYEPTGVAAVISPWNFPFCQFVWQVIPNLVVGNTVVFKHASECSPVGQLIEKCIAASQLPSGVFAEVYGGGEVGEVLIHENVDLICFTGSEAVGQKIYKVAAEKMIKVLLELGGSAPAIAFEDTDLANLAEVVFFNRFANSGQVCDGLKRLIVHKSIAQQVEKVLVEMIKTKKVGDPQNSSTDIGPLVNKKQAATLQAQVEDAKQKGAKILIGGSQPQGLSEAFFEPTIITNVTTDMKVWHEEVFGPVLPIMTFETEEQAIALANGTDYGLGGYVLTKDPHRAARVSAKMKTGMISVNGTLYLHPPSPFGGYKKSGIGREHGKYGFHELCQIKVVAMEK